MRSEAENLVTAWRNHFTTPSPATEASCSTRKVTSCSPSSTATRPTCHCLGAARTGARRHRLTGARGRQPPRTAAARRLGFFFRAALTSGERSGPCGDDRRHAPGLLGRGGATPRPCRGRTPARARTSDSNHPAHHPARASEDLAALVLKQERRLGSLIALRDQSYHDKHGTSTARRRARGRPWLVDRRGGRRMSWLERSRRRELPYAVESREVSDQKLGRAMHLLFTRHLVSAARAFVPIFARQLAKWPSYTPEVPLPAQVWRALYNAKHVPAVPSPSLTHVARPAPPATNSGRGAHGRASALHGEQVRSQRHAPTGSARRSTTA